MRTVTKGVEALIKKGIMNIRAVINPKMVGYGVLADVFIETEPGRLLEVVDWVAEFP